jgi:hypothetical protein
MEAHDLYGGIALERPANGGGIEAAGDRLAAVRRNGKGTHRSAVAAQLGMCCAKHKRKQCEGEAQTFDATEHHATPVKPAI